MTVQAATAAALPPSQHPPSCGDHRNLDVRDMHGFAVKPDLRRLYERFAPIYVEEEAERSVRWAEFLQETEALLGKCASDEDEAAMLRRLLAHLEGSSAAGSSPGVEPAQAAALLQRLASLVQAGLPMAKRGVFWRLFLNIESKRQDGEYDRLMAQVEAIERRLAGDATADSGTAAPTTGGAKSATVPGMTKLATAAAAEEVYRRYSIVNMVADATSRGEAGAGPASTEPPTAGYRHRVSTFSVTPLEDEEEADESLPECMAGQAGSGCSILTQAAAVPQSDGMQQTPQAARSAKRAGDAPACATVPLAAQTPASTLLTPLSSSSEDTTGLSGGASCGLASTAGTTSTAGTAERWRQQDYLAQIDKDLHRTFPDHPCMDENGRATLRRILAAYSLRNPDVGYCQGLNFLGATFLLFMKEEDAFWCLCALIEDILGPGYFDQNMLSVQVDVLVFGHLLQGRFPTLWRHFQALEVDPASACMHWFLCCFLNSLPLDPLLRVWDQLFFEGSPVVLFRVALALVEIYNQPLMSTHESSDVYMLLQGCAQMTFDGSGLVDTAACGYAHLQPAGLAVLRQRHRRELWDGLRGMIGTNQEAQGMPGLEGCDGEDGATSAQPSFAHRFRRLSSMLLEVEEATQRTQHQQPQAGGDSGHLSPPRSWAGSSKRSSPGLSSGSQPASPLARVQVAVRAVTSRLMPSSLPVLLPAGAVGAGGQELETVAAGPSSRASSRVGQRQQAPAAAAAAGRPRDQHEHRPSLRRISVGERSGSAAGSSPTSSLSHSAGSGATLARHAGPGSRLVTPFSEVDTALSASLPQQPQRGNGLQPGHVASTPQRVPPVLAQPWAAAAQSQPATPNDRQGLAELQPASGQRRAHTAGYPEGSRVHTRRRRRLTIDLLDLHSLANLRLDLRQPALAAAFAIAANPSPRAGSRSSCRSGGVEGPGASPLGMAGDTPGHASAPVSCDQEAALPIRALCFDEQEATGQDEGGSSDALVVHRSATAPCEAALADTPGEEAPAAPRLAGSTPARLRGGPGAPALDAPSLLPVVAHLQEEVAVAESRRHEAEQAAQQQQQKVADLRRQLGKVQKQLAAKETMVAELSGRLAAADACIAELGGEVTATLLAVQAEETAADRGRRQLAAADALIRRLMDAVAQTQAHALHGGSSAGASTASAALSVCSGSAPSKPTGSACSTGSDVGDDTGVPGSPQSSIGSVGVVQLGSSARAAGGRQ